MPNPLLLLEAVLFLLDFLLLISIGDDKRSMVPQRSRPGSFNSMTAQMDQDGERSFVIPRRLSRFVVRRRRRKLVGTEFDFRSLFLRHRIES
mmetsp:Transcript_898/g.2087  ORF Transcript_898/g.2087 Transcript_898/m.2087 type:complete len:92 (+) Transcript_898:1400-1675(+)